MNSLVRLGRLVALQREFAGAERDPERVQARQGLLRRFAGAQTANDVQPIRTVVVEVAPLRLNDRLHGYRNVEIRTPAPDHAVEARRRDSSNTEWVAIDEQRLADNGGLREMALPVIEGKHRHGVGIFSRFVTGQKQPAGCRLHAERLESSYR